jgi:hypothetical protein
MKPDQPGLSRRLFRVLLHPHARALAAVAAVLGLYLGLSRQGYPWWLWTPACFLGAVFTLWLWLLMAYGYQKRTYPYRALEAKRRRLQAQREREEP